jgi:hypothetical protein
LRDVNASNIEEWKRKITELWTIKMAQRVSKKAGRKHAQEAV